jgi:GNAT superfamily N-acetyltransferase
VTVHDTAGVSIIPFDRARVRACDFECGKPDLDEWLHRYAGQQERTDSTRTFLALSPDGTGVVGYYATTTYVIGLDELSVEHGIGKRRYPIPAVLLARLAVDRRWHGRGLGSLLLTSALTGIATANRSIGFEVVVVDAIDDEAVTFYAKHGFSRFERNRRKLFLTLQDLRATLGVG